MFRGYISQRSGIAERGCGFGRISRRRFERMSTTSPNKGAAPNRRLRLGPVPWSLEALTSQGSAVGELDRSAASNAGDLTGANGENGDGLDPLFSLLPPVEFGSRVSRERGRGFLFVCFAWLAGTFYAR